MKILITGGTGFIGSALSARLLTEGHEVTVIGSRPGQRRNGDPRLTRISADTTRPGFWQARVAEQDALINLAGVSVFAYWSKARKDAIYGSRILTTKNLVEALPERSQAVLISASAAGYYGHGGEEEKIETSPVGSDFLAEVCRDWEKEASKAAAKGARVVLTRFGVVLGKGGGALQTMKLPFKLGLGGSIGSGQQWFPWIHLDDLVAALCFLLQAEDCRGPFNCVAPQTVRQQDFARSLAAALQRPAKLQVPALVMRLALGEFGRSLLQGQKVLPKALSECGYVFQYPELAPTLQALLDT